MQEKKKKQQVALALQIARKKNILMFAYSISTETNRKKNKIQSHPFEIPHSQNGLSIYYMAPAFHRYKDHHLIQK
jgi:hypothetical protein